MKNKPNILITNDDGILAPGIRHLWNALKEIANVTVVAPLTEQSATSLGITIQSPLRLEEHIWPGDTKVWSVSGTPADSVKLALHAQFDTPPDLIVSGINRGNNAGRNVLYSGTVAGVVEGVLHDIPGIAFSCQDYFHPNFETAEEFIPRIVEHVLRDHPLPKGSLLNVNFPSKNNGVVKGFKSTKQGKQFWAENPDMRAHPAQGHQYYWLGAKIAEFEEDPESDISLLDEGYITATPIQISELTDEVYRSSHQESFEKLF